MTLTDEHLLLAIRHVAEVAQDGYSARLLGDGASWVIDKGVAVVVNPMLLDGSCILHLGEPCLLFRSVPLCIAFPHRPASIGCWRAIPFRALGLAHEVAA